MVTAAAIHMALLGADGLERVAAGCSSNLSTLSEKLTQIEGVETIFDRPVFHEQVVSLPLPASKVLSELATQEILGGYDLSKDYPELGDAVLVCTSEKRTQQEMDRFAQKLSEMVSAESGGKK
jgi:glycine dehydrogenase subunit 1